MVEVFGDSSSLRIEIEWTTPSDAVTAAEGTYGKLRLFIKDDLIWCGTSPEGGIEWTWIELAEFLANAWPWLLAEEGFPLDIRGGNLTEVEAELRRLWDSRPALLRESEQEQVYEFEEAHNLAHGLNGLTLPSVWLVKEGRNMWLCSKQLAVSVPFSSVMVTIESFSQAIVDRAMSSHDSRASQLHDSWKQRSELPPASTIEIATGLDADLLLEVAQQGDVVDFWQFNKHDVDRNELVAAARMSAALPADDIACIVNTVRAAGGSISEKLELTAQRILDVLGGGTPYDQGYFAAAWLREDLGLTDLMRAEPEEILTLLEVGVDELSLKTSLVDAVACWGPNHGPIVFINSEGKFANSIVGRRTTLAHEICHLLLDRSGALPLVEVLGGKAPARVEERARAFAAELLAPREYVGHEFSMTDTPDRTLRHLRQQFGVGAELIAWQARNSSSLLPADVRAFLRSQVSRPWRF